MVGLLPSAKGLQQQYSSPDANSTAGTNLGIFIK